MRVFFAVLASAVFLAALASAFFTFLVAGLPAVPLLLDLVSLGVSVTLGSFLDDLGEVLTGFAAADLAAFLATAALVAGLLAVDFTAVLLAADFTAAALDATAFLAAFLAAVLVAVLAATDFAADWVALAAFLAAGGADFAAVLALAFWQLLSRVTW